MCVWYKSTTRKKGKEEEEEGVTQCHNNNNISVTEMKKGKERKKEKGWKNKKEISSITHAENRKHCSKHSSRMNHTI